MAIFVIVLELLLPAAAAIITFLYTEDLSNTMGLVDRWTWLMLLYIILQLVLVFFIRRKTEKEKAEEEKMAE